MAPIPAWARPTFMRTSRCSPSGRWYLFDPTGISPLTGLIRIATGTDAADVPFAMMFGDVRTTMPKISFAAAPDLDAGISLPRPTTLAVSTAEV
jgi:hypothetical protein